MIRTSKLSIALGCLLALGVCLVGTPAFAADGDCLQWDVSGSWHVSQSNGTNVLMKIQQNGTHIQGVAEYSYYNNDAKKVQTVSGPVDGSFDAGSILRVTAYWSNGTAGNYTGQVGLDGGMTGHTAKGGGCLRSVNHRVAAYGYRGGSLFERRDFSMAATLVKHPQGDLLIDTGFPVTSASGINHATIANAIASNRARRKTCESCGRPRHGQFVADQRCSRASTRA